MADPSPSSSLDLLGDGFCTCSSVLLTVGDGVRLKDAMNSESRYLKEPNSEVTGLKERWFTY